MMRMNLIVFGMLLSLPLAAREIVSLDAGWRFVKGDPAQAALPSTDDSSWQSVTLPHTWNAQDGEEHDDYYRGPGWYRRWIQLPERGQKTFVRFGAASLAAEVYCNGKKIGEHLGGFTAFVVDISACAQPGRSTLLAVRVSNAKRSSLAPLKADFTFFGGLYRDVNLISTGNLYITPTDYGSSGVYLSPSLKTSTLGARLELANDSGSAQPIILQTKVLDENGFVVAKKKTPLSLPSGRSESTVELPIADPRPWDTHDPYLYRVEVSLESPSGKLLDRVWEQTGFRTVAADPNTGFSLNGKPLELRGVGLHQDWKDKGWAIGPKEWDRNVSTLKEMGANAVRLAHYPQAPGLINRLDRDGIVAWSEIPLVDAETSSQAFVDSTKTQLEEMIHQYYNHPSIAFWGLFNELKEDPMGLVPALNDLAHREDPSRMTTAATDCTPNGHAGGGIGMPCDFSLASIPETIAFNRYDGWYYRKLGSMGKFLDAMQKLFPHTAIGVSEYGAGASVNQHQDPPQQPGRGSHFHPEEYQSLAHEAWLSQLEGRPNLFGHFVWDMFDFAAANRDEGEVPGINDKGLVGFDHATRKDSFYLYKASWTRTPVLHLTSKSFTQRTGPATDIKVYSNLPEVELFLNGELVGSERRQGNSVVFLWKNLPLKPGRNLIEVRAGMLSDHAIWELTNSDTLGSEPISAQQNLPLIRTVPIFYHHDDDHAER